MFTSSVPTICYHTIYYTIGYIPYDVPFISITYSMNWKPVSSHSTSSILSIPHSLPSGKYQFALYKSISDFCLFMGFLDFIHK